jgi:Fic family protein
MQILAFILGWQGGTVHQVADELKVSVQDVLNADDDKMQNLCRMAQYARLHKNQSNAEKRNKAAILELSSLIDGDSVTDSSFSHIIHILEGTI